MNDEMLILRAHEKALVDQAAWHIPDHDRRLFWIDWSNRQTASGTEETAPMPSVIAAIALEALDAFQAHYSERLDDPHASTPTEGNGSNMSGDLGEVVHVRDRIAEELEAVE